MKKSLGLKICAGLAVVSALAFLPAKTFATTNTTLKVGGETLFSGEPNGKKSNLQSTATYDVDKKILYLSGYNQGAITTDIDALTIVVTDDSAITGTSAGIATVDGASANITVSINEGKKLTAKGGVDLHGTFTLSSGSLDLGEGALKVTNGNVKFTGGSLTAGSVLLSDTDATTQAKISIDATASVKVSKSINAVYNFAATEKGISLANKICSNPAAEVTNINGTGSAKVTTTLTNATATNGITTGVELSTAACSAEGASAPVDNPDTFDMVYVYAALLVASSAILGYRRYIAKR